MKTRTVTRKFLQRNKGVLVCAREGCGHRFEEGEEMIHILSHGKSRPAKVFCPGCFFAEPIKEAGEAEIEGLIICKSCGNLVPDAIVCIYCGEQLHPLGWTPRRGE